MNRRCALLSLASVALALSRGPALAGTGIPFEKAAFAAAQSAGKSILLYIDALWCGACQVQEGVVANLEKDADFKDYVIFIIDYDNQKDVMRSFGATSRGTLIAFKGMTEIGRLVGDTKLASIKSLMLKGL